MKMLKHGVTLGVGLILKRAVDWPFDYIMYPAALLYLGNMAGGVFMTLLSIIVNILIIRAYDWVEVDWFLIERLKDLKEKPSKPEGVYKRFLSYILKKGDVVAFFVLCMDDPITTTLYLRKGAFHFNGFGRRDWWIFTAATIVSNLYWIIGLGTIIEIAKTLF
ncbi:MAG: hypothetical protein K8Q91_01905 [Candidatus Vogelbacteria bacterium]|nr:hypothetical protein [Candidatus Vogelbacteria bacterium]